MIGGFGDDPAADMTPVPPGVQALRDHIDRDHGIMVQLGIIADSAVKMLEHVNMDTGEDRELHARAVSALRARLGEIAATMKEANDAAFPFLAATPGTTTYLCSTHRRTVTAGSGEGVLVHTGGNGIAECSSARITVTVKREATRAEVLALLSGGEVPAHAEGRT